MAQEGPELSRSCRGDVRLGISHSNISPDAFPQTRVLQRLQNMIFGEPSKLKMKTANCGLVIGRWK